MPQIEEAALQSLQETCREVAFRSKRLEEWLKFESHVRLLLRSFEELCREAHGAASALKAAAANPLTPMSPDILPRLNRLWESCQNVDFIDLESFAQSICYIDKPLPNSILPATQVGDWIAELLQQGENINQEMLGMRLDSVDQLCTAVQQKLKKQVSALRR